MRRAHASAQKENSISKKLNAELDKHELRKLQQAIGLEADWIQNASDQELLAYLSVHGFDGSFTDLGQIKDSLNFQFLNETTKVQLKLLKRNGVFNVKGSGFKPGPLGAINTIARPLVNMAAPTGNVSLEDFSSWYSCSSQNCNFQGIEFHD